MLAQLYSHLVMVEPVSFSSEGQSLEEISKLSNFGPPRLPFISTRSTRGVYIKCPWRSSPVRYRISVLMAEASSFEGSLSDKPSISSCAYFILQHLRKIILLFNMRRKRKNYNIQAVSNLQIPEMRPDIICVVSKLKGYDLVTWHLFGLLKFPEKSLQANPDKLK